MTRFETITGKDNAKIKLARAVRDGREDKLCFSEGLRLCLETIRSRVRMQFSLVSESAADSNRFAELLESFRSEKVPVYVVDDAVFAGVAETKSTQGIVIISERPQTGREVLEPCLANNPLFVFLHRLNNPANMGGIFRTCEAAGVSGIVTSKGTTDAFSAKSLRGGMGANFRIPVWTEAGFAEVIEWAAENGIRTVCADVRAENSYLETDWQIPRMLIIGSEGHGLTEAEFRMTDDSLLIPMANGVESLNAGVAAAVILFEAKRQRDSTVTVN